MRPSIMTSLSEYNIAISSSLAQEVNAPLDKKSDSVKKTNSLISQMKRDIGIFKQGIKFVEDIVYESREEMKKALDNEEH